jgi:hypothetical protein
MTATEPPENNAATSKAALSDYAYTVNMKEDASATSFLGKIDFDLGIKYMPSQINLLLYLLTGNVTLAAASEVHLSYIGGDNLGFTALITDPKDATKQEYAYCKTIDLESILPLVVSRFLPMISKKSSSPAVATPSYRSSLAIPTFADLDFSGLISKIDLSQYLPIINGLLTFDDTDGTKGISLSPAGVAGLQALIETAKGKVSLLKTLLPQNLTGIKFTVDLDESGAFKDFALVIKDTAKIKDSTDATGVATVDYPYDYFTADCKKAAAPAADYFTKLSSTLEVVEADAEKVDDCLRFKDALDATLIQGTEINSSGNTMEEQYSVYNALLTSDAFNSELEQFVTKFNNLLSGDNKLTNTYMFNPAILEYGPYYSFHAKKSGMIVMDNAYEASVGDVISLADEDVAPAIVDVDTGAFTYTIEGNTDTAEDGTVTTYVNYDANAKTLTVNSLPEEARFVTITPVLPEASLYHAVSFRFLLPAAPAAIK